jgi:hypothetical protein
MDTQGLDIIPDPPLLPFDATQTSLAFFPLGFLLLFPLFLFFFHFPLAGPPMRSIHLIPATTIGLCQLKCPIAPAQHHLSIPQGTLERVRKVGKRPTETDHLAARQPQKRDIQTKEVFCSPFLKDQINLSSLPSNDDRKMEVASFPSSIRRI